MVEVRKGFLAFVRLVRLGFKTVADLCLDFDWESAEPL
jgi:hypothetical protein